MSSVFEELCRKFKLTRASDEGYDHFARRAVKKVNSCTDAQWNDLTEGAQRWTNATLKAVEEAGADDEIELAAIKMGDSDDAEEIEFGWPEEAAGGDDSGDNGDEEADEGQSGGGDAEDDDDPEAEEQEDGGSEDDGGGDNPEEGVDAEANSGQEEAPEEATPRRAPKKGKAAKPSTSAEKSKTPSKQGKAKDMKSKTTKTPAARATASGAARTSVAPTGTIKILVKGNPHREGTKLHGYFKKYKEGMTVEAALKAGIPARNIAYETSIGKIKVVNAKKAAA
jgi:hypothetical protein